MERLSVVAAERELSSARAFLTALHQATDIKDVHRLWSAFLIDANRVFTRLEHGSKGSLTKPWYGQIKYLRKNDPLLQYIKQARDANEHGDPLIGNEIILHGIEAKTSHFFTSEGLLSGVSAGSSFNPRQLHTLPVTTRSGTYQPPRSHLGKPIYPALETIADLTIDYLTQLVAEARARML